MSIDWIAQHPLTEIIGWTLVHFVWQGCLIALLAKAALGLARNASAVLRYWMGCAGLVAMAAAPLVTAAVLVMNHSAADSARVAQVDIADRSLADHRAASLAAAEPAGGGDHAGPAPSIAELELPGDSATGGLETVGNRDQRSASATPLLNAIQRTERWLEPILPWCVTLWAAGVFLLCGRLGSGLWRIRQWRRQSPLIEDESWQRLLQKRSRQMGIRTVVQLRRSLLVTVPTVIGWIRPAVLIPASMLTGLTPRELELILVHELAHVRRHDYAINLIQVFVETLLFYHPAVWWLSQQIRQEREHCCDDTAIALGGSRLAFAKALARMEQLRTETETLALTATGGSLMQRIRRIVSPSAPLRNQSRWVGSLTMLITISALGGSAAIAWAMTTPRDVPIEPQSADIQSVAASQEPDDNRPADVPKRKSESVRVDSRTGMEQRVYEGVKLSTGAGDVQKTATLAMKYSNVIAYSIIPASLAKELDATVLGVVDFGEEAPERHPAPAQTALFEAVDRQRLENGTLRTAQQGSQGEDTAEPIQTPGKKVLSVSDVLEPVDDFAEIQPYLDDAVWLPGHLAFYGLNQTHQHRFTLVRIESVDLGVGLPFGPVNALVSHDENSDFGLLGSDWVGKVRGEDSEGLWFSAADSEFFLMTGPSESELLRPSPGDETHSDGSGQMTVESQGHESGPQRRDRPGVQVLETCQYNLSRRQSTGWVELRGANVPIDHGVSHDGITAYVTLMFDVVGVDSASGETIWSLPWGKTQPIWRTISVVEAEWADGPLVELFAVDGKSRKLIYRYVRLSDGESVEPPPAESAQHDQDADDALPEIRVVERTVDGDHQTIKRAVAEASLAGRSAVEMLKHFAMGMRLRGEFQPSGSITNMETIVSAEKINYLFGPGMDAPEVLFNLPEGSGLRAEFFGDAITIEPQQDHVRVTVTNGRLQLLDSNGVVRADASADGGAEQLVVDCRTSAGEVVMAMHTQRIEPSAEYPHPPVQVKLNTATGAPEDEEEPPHGAIRYEIQAPDANGESPMRMKMMWRYEMPRLIEQVERETGQTWEQILGDEQPLQLDPRSPEPETDVLEFVEQLGDWLDNPQVRFDSPGYRKLAVALLQLDEATRIEHLREIGRREFDGQLIALCRILFEPREGTSQFRSPKLGQPEFIPREATAEDFPLQPIAWVEGFPLRIVRVYDVSGSPEPAADYLEYCLRDLRFRDSLPTSTGNVANAIGPLTHAAWWRNRLDVDEWVQLTELRNQLQPTALVTISKMEHVDIDIPSMALNRAVGLNPETAGETLAEQKIPQEALLIVMISDNAKVEWIHSLVVALQQAGWADLEFVRWQQSRDPIEMPELDTVWRKTAAPTDDDDANPDQEWGPVPAAGDLRLKLTALDTDLAVGEPLRLKLELKNFGDLPQSYDPQVYAAFRVLRVVDEAGEPDQFIGMTPQTSGGPVELQPRESTVLWDAEDAAELYMLDAGDYTVHVAAPGFADGHLPESNKLSLTIQPGTQTPLKRLLKELAKDLPPDWSVSNGWGAVFLSYTPTNLKRDAGSIQLWFTADPLPKDFQLGTGEREQRVSTLGQFDLGWMHVAADPRSQEVWANYLDHIRAAIEQSRIKLVERQRSVEPQDPNEADQKLPWRATGTVKDAEGKPIEGAEVFAHCGMGTLHRTGSAKTDAEGRYDLSFGPGIWMEDRQSVQAATISVHVPGHFEKNLHRQGDLVAAFERPEGDIGWGGKTDEDLFLPGKPKTIDFVMLPATRIRGMVINEDGKRPAGIRVSITGDELPPSSSVIDEVRTDEEGKFEIDDIPTGYTFQIMVEPAAAESPWLAWASPPLTFQPGDTGDTHIKYEIGGHPVDFSCQYLYLTLQGDGVNWKTALKEAADRPLELKWDGLSTDDVVRAGMAYLELK